MDIPHAQELRDRAAKAKLESHRKKVADDVLRNTERRLATLRGEVVRELAKPDVTAVEVIVAKIPISYPPGDRTPTEIYDFGSHYAAAKQVVIELQAKGYSTSLRIVRDYRSAPMVEDDALALTISW